MITTAADAGRTTNESEWLRILDEIGPRFEAGSSERDTGDVFVAAHYPVLKECGLISALVPAELGGGGMSHSTMSRLLRRLAFYDPSTALALSMHQHLVAFQLFNHRHGRPAPLLPRVASEQLVLVSTGARDWLESNGSMRRVDDGFHVSARKAFASGSPVGDVAVTSAPYEDPELGWQVLHFAVPLRAPGVRLEDDWQVHGMRSTGSQTLVFDDVFVPEGAISLRRPRGEFHDVFNLVVVAAIPLITAVYVGVAERASAITLELLPGGQAVDPTVEWAVGEMQSALIVSRTLHDRMNDLAHDLDLAPSLDLTSELLALKAEAVSAAQVVVERAMEAAGGRAFYRRTGLEQLLRDVRAGDFHPLPRKQQVRFTGRYALGLPPVQVE